MIIATGSVNIDENKKLAEDAADKAGDMTDALKGLKTSIDGTITTSDRAPFDDGKSHSEGDLWIIMNGNIATAMYTWTNGAFQEKKWDQASLNVKTLSALTANLGSVNAGSINGVSISGSSIEGGAIHIGAPEFDYWLDYNGFHTQNTIDSSSTWIYGGAVAVGTSKFNPSVQLLPGGIYANGTRIHTSNFTISSGSVIGTVSGKVYFENGYGDSGGGGAEVHAASFDKMSQLSVKRNILDVSGDYALAQIAGTDVKRYDYKDTDNAKQTNIGPIIDDKNAIGNKQYNVSSDMLSSGAEGVSIDNEVGLLMAAVKELAKRNSELSMRVTQLERKG